jgi:hypothetical protein
MVLSRQVQGPFVVTIFIAAEPLQNSPDDISVLVQERDSNNAILDAIVDLTFITPVAQVGEAAEQFCGASTSAVLGTHPEQFTVPATRKQASNRLLYAAAVKFDTVGDWQLQALVERGSNAAKIACSIPVGSPPRQLTGLLPYLALPPVIVALFAANQRLRRQSTENRRR